MTLLAIQSYPQPLKKTPMVWMGMAKGGLKEVRTVNWMKAKATISALVDTTSKTARPLDLEVVAREHDDMSSLPLLVVCLYLVHLYHHLSILFSDFNIYLSTFIS